MLMIKMHSGDDGKTNTLGEERLPKYDLRIETLGAIDEASSAIGLAKAQIENKEIRDTLTRIQRDLYHMMSEIASEDADNLGIQKVDQENIDWLETIITSLQAKIKDPRGFIIPGDSISGAGLDFARVTVRRAERRLTHLYADVGVENQANLGYINRLSTVLFIFELYEHNLNREPGYSMARDD